MNLYRIIHKPVVTEKSNQLQEDHEQYVFEVHPDANKIEIKQAIEKLFEVRVRSVRTHVVRGKVKTQTVRGGGRKYHRTTGKKPNRKRAVVTLYEGDSIDIFKGV